MFGAKRIFPFACHDPPRAQADCSVTIWVASLATSIRRSAPEVKYATERESGDQNGKMPLSVSGSGFSSNVSNRRSQSWRPFVMVRFP